VVAADAAATGSRVLAICADDIGLADGAAETALGLFSAGRLSSASCVSTGPFWRRDGAQFSQHGGDLGAPARLELGLHFNLTEGVPASRSLAAHWPRLPGLGRLIALAHLGALPLAAIADEWQAQADAFAERVGREPDFMDGHQHVHHLPGVRSIVLDGARRFRVAPAIRSTGRLAGPGAAFKRRVIEATGGRALEAALRARGFRHNRILLGAYDFRGDYRRHVVGWLAAAPAEGGLLFCHPSTAAAAGANGRSDAIADARRREAAYLASAEFGADLAAAGVSLGPAWATRSSSAG
jgi:predicted glycoside hydrolase/deacetylase ChbG (UPF0249 family)